MGGGKNSIPKGWIGCPHNGNQLVASKFLVSKTPLSKNFDSKISSPEYLYHPEDVFRWAKRKKKKIGLWIDLTNTDRYYPREEVENKACRYVKISCAGHGTCPSRRRTIEFISLCHNFMKEWPQECIVVHCTHGFNRTGYFIVSFLVENLGFSVANAVKEFSRARPPGIYRLNYIQQLFQQYGQGIRIPPAPKLPFWCIEGKPECKNREFISRRTERDRV